MPGFAISADELIERYGDQAYHVACEFTVIALNVGDREGCRAYAAAARELMLRGFHKHPCIEPISGMPESISPNAKDEG